MAEFIPIKDMKAEFVPDPLYQKKEIVVRSDRDEGLALEVMKLVVELHKGREPPSDLVLLSSAERWWKWLITEEWPFNGSPTQNIDR